MCRVNIENATVRMGLTGADLQYIDTIWHWANHMDAKSAGPEFCCFNSFKYTKHGQRPVLCIEFETAESFVKATLGQGSSLTMQKNVDTCAEIDVKTLVSMLKVGVNIVFTTVPEGSGLFVPWGWITAEQNNNGKDSSGYRWCLLGDDAPSCFRKIANYTMPDDPRKVKANSTAALLAKVLEALKINTAAQLSDAAKSPVAVKTEHQPAGPSPKSQRMM